MNLYHGTSYSAYQQILKDGMIKPRGKSPGVWDIENTASHPNMVYFSGGYKPTVNFHALHAAHLVGDDKCVIIEVESDYLDASCFRVDENFLDLEKRGAIANCPALEREAQRSAAYTDVRWMQSLAVVGLCAYANIVPQITFTNITIVKNEDNPCWREEMVNIPNDRIARARYWNKFLSDEVWWINEVDNWADMPDGIAWLESQGNRYATMAERMKKRNIF